MGAAMPKRFYFIIMTWIIVSTFYYLALPFFYDSLMLSMGIYFYAIYGFDKSLRSHSIPYEMNQNIYRLHLNNFIIMELSADVNQILKVIMSLNSTYKNIGEMFLFVFQL